MVEGFMRKMFRFLRMGKSRIKTCGLSYVTSLLFSFSSQLFLKRRPFLHLPCHALFPHPHLRTRERTRPCASRTQRVRNSCLHPSPPPTIRWYSVFFVWRKYPFSAFTGEGNKGETFTHKSLFPSFLQSYGEEVKEKTKNSGRVRVGAEMGGRCTFEKVLLVVGGALQVLDKPKTRSLRKISSEKLWRTRVTSPGAFSKNCLSTTFTRSFAHARTGRACWCIYAIKFYWEKGCWSRLWTTNWRISFRLTHASQKHQRVCRESHGGHGSI